MIDIEKVQAIDCHAYADMLLKNELSSGWHWPAITPDRWLAGFAAAPVRDGVRPLLLKENARRVLGIEG